MSVQKLIDQTFSYAIEAKGTDLEQLYLDDMKSFQEARFLMAMKDFDRCSTHIDEMDTEPREQILLAIAEEFGNKFLVKMFGYEVA